MNRNRLDMQQTTCSIVISRNISCAPLSIPMTQNTTKLDSQMLDSHMCDVFSNITQGF